MTERKTRQRTTGKAVRGRLHLVETEMGPDPATLAGEPAEDLEPAADVALESERDAEAGLTADAGTEPAPGAKKAAGSAVRGDAGESKNFLGMYFKEMATLGILRPEQEFEAARDLERLEVGLWEALFSYPPAVDLVLRVVERAMDNSLTEFRALRSGARRAGSRATRRQLDRLRVRATRVGERLRALDIDRRYVAHAMKEVFRIGRGEPSGMMVGRLAFAPGGAAFRGYVSAVRDACLGVQRSKNYFVKANLRLVVSIARRFNHGLMPLPDLIQEGNIGLMKAVERYDYRRGFRFSTYASWWIRHAISRALADKGRAVRLPVHMIDAYHRVAKATREMQTKLGRPPSADEIGEAAGLDGEKVEKMRTYLLDQSFSLDRTVSEEDGRKFVDFLTDPEGTPTLTDRLVLEATTDEVRRQLDDLKPIEADILRQRFGLDTDQELTLKEIGEKYDLSRERIRQLQEQALVKMRKALERKDLL